MNSLSGFNILLVILCFLAVPALSALETTQGDSDGTGLSSNYRINIGKLEQAIHKHRGWIREREQQEQSLLAEIARLEKKIHEQEETVAELQRRLRTQENLLELKKKDRRQAEQTREQVRRHLEQRLRVFYLHGRKGFLNVAFSQRSLPELILFQEAFQHLLTYDRAIFSLYRNTLDQVRRSEEAIALEQKLLLDFIEDAREASRQLNRTREEKSRLVDHIRTEKQLYEQAILEMQKAEQSLAKKLRQVRPTPASRGFAARKGKLPAPASGTLLRTFGEQWAGSIGGKGVTQGISLQVADNTPVRAVASGKVLYADYMLGYGNTVIVDHGGHYYTITARLERIDKKAGDTVATGEIIGATGSIASLFGQGLYFEIRHKTTPLDPLQWLKPGLFRKSAASSRSSVDKR